MTIGRNVAIGDLLIFAAYLFGAAVLLYLIGRPSYILADESKMHPRLQWLYTSLLPYFLLQFLFGSLLSALFILYFKSSSHWLAFIVTLILGVLLVANEFLESKYKRFTLSWSLFGLCAILFFNFALPFVLGSVYSAWFYFSTLMGAGLVVFLYKKTPNHQGSIVPVWLIAGTLMSAYWFDMIPPVPLVKRDIAMAYDIQKVGSQYQLVQQAAPWYIFWRKSSDDLVMGAGQQVFCFSSIFAPAGLKTKLYHDWQLHTKYGWVTQSRAGFGLHGGRNDGFRGFTYKSNVVEGDWRVQIKTENDKTIAIHYFQVARGDSGTQKVMIAY